MTVKMASKQLSIELPRRGPMDVVFQNQNGKCTIVKASVNSLLQVGNNIVLMNGITMSDVMGGVQAWVKLFKAFADSDRKLIVQRAGVIGKEKNQMQAAENIAASISVSTNFLVVDAVAAAYENGARAGGSGRRKNALKVSTKHNETKRQKMDQDDKKPPAKKSGANQKVHSGDKDKASGVEVISLIDN